MLRWATVWPQHTRAAVPLSVGELGPHLTQFAWAEAAYLRTKWHPDPSSRLATINMGRGLDGRRPKTPILGDAVPLSVGGGGSSSNTMWPGLRPTSVPSGIFPSNCLVTKTPMLQTDRQDNRPVARANR